MRAGIIAIIIDYSDNSNVGFWMLDVE